MGHFNDEQKLTGTIKGFYYFWSFPDILYRMKKSKRLRVSLQFARYDNSLTVYAVMLLCCLASVVDLEKSLFKQCYNVCDRRPTYVECRTASVRSLEAVITTLRHCLGFFHVCLFIFVIFSSILSVNFDE